MGTRIDRLPLETHTPLVDRAQNPQDYLNEFANRYRRDWRDVISGLRELSNNTGLLIPVILTVNLPNAAISMNGRILIEDTGAVGNLIVYARGARYRFVGVAF